MEKLNIPETYRKPTLQPQTTLIYEQGVWDSIPYRPNLDCPVCKGAGFLHPSIGENVIYAKIIPCRAPSCLLDSVRGKVAQATLEQTFDIFQPVPGAKQALQAAKALASGEAKFVWLLIYGGTGCGKTHLANAIVRQVRDRGLDVRIVLAADFFSLLRETIKDNKTDEILRQFKDIGFLAIDDYGVEYGSDWERAKFDELMTSRYAKALPTVVVTNKDLADLPDRVRSRFTDKVMARAIQNSAPDFRRYK